MYKTKKKSKREKRKQFIVIALLISMAIPGILQLIQMI